VAQQVGRLGSEVLLMVFKFHRVAQKKVLSQLLNKIITGCNSPSVDSYFSEWVGMANVYCIKWVWLHINVECKSYHFTYLIQSYLVTSGGRGYC